MATPLIELTATLSDLLGGDAGTIADPARLRITLCGYGLTLPRIAGTSVVAQIVYDAASTGDEIDISIWGNDQITPGGTYYTIEVLDGDGQTVQTGAYQFTGGGAVDLSTAAQLNPPPPTPPIVSYFNLGGKLTTANIVLHAGAGTGAFIAGIDGTDGNHRIVIGLGTSPAAGQPIYTLTFTQDRGHVTFPVFVLQPSLTGTPPFPLFSASSSGYTMMAGITPLGPAGSGTFMIHVICP